MASYPLLTAVFLLLALTGFAQAKQLKVISISDGDTPTGLHSQTCRGKHQLSVGDEATISSSRVALVA
jgi:hypothetical protein